MYCLVQPRKVMLEQQAHFLTLLQATLQKSEKLLSYLLLTPNPVATLPFIWVLQTVRVFNSCKIVSFGFYRCRESTLEKYTSKSFSSGLRTGSCASAVVQDCLHRGIGDINLAFPQKKAKMQPSPVKAVTARRPESGSFNNMVTAQLAVG